MSLKSEGGAGPLRLLKAKDQPQTVTTTPVMDASVLAKLAEDVIAWNRQLSPSEVSGETRPARVAQLESLRCGLKIIAKDEPLGGEVRRLFKE